MKVVLFQPQIPQNTGNIIRTCSVTGCQLILIPPFGFSLSDRHLKRARLDYLEEVEVSQVENIESELKENFYFFSSKGKIRYTDCHFSKDSILIFGSETGGLPQEIHEKYPKHFATIPMCSGKRCLNLATSVGIVVYEAIRQIGFDRFFSEKI